MIATGPSRTTTSPAATGFGALSSVAEGALLGVSRQALIRHALTAIPERLRSEVGDIALEPKGRVIHHGVIYDQIIWRCSWRRTGWAPLSGPIAVRDGCIAGA